MRRIPQENPNRNQEIREAEMREVMRPLRVGEINPRGAFDLVQPAYHEQTGAVNHETLYKIYYKLQNELVEALRIGDINSGAVNSALDDLCGTIDSIKERPALASDPDYQYEVYTKMTKAVQAMDQAFEACQQKAPENRRLLQKLAIMSTVARYMQQIHGHQLMTLPENGFSANDERQKKFRLNESKLEAHTIGCGVGSGLDDPQTRLLGTATQGTASFTSQVHTFVDPNGPPVILDGYEIRVGGRQTIQTNFENAQEGTPESNYKPLYTGSGFGGWFNIRHESLIGVSNEKDTYFNDLKRNTRTYDEGTLLRRAPVVKNDGLWSIRNRIVDGISKPQNLKNEIAIKQLECDTKNANHGSALENAYLTKAKQFIRTAEGWVGGKVGNKSQTDQRPISSIERAKGAIPSEFVDYVDAHSQERGGISMGLAQMLHRAYSDLTSFERADEMGLPPFRGYITTLGVNAYVNYVPSPGVWAFSQPNRNTPSSFFNVSATGQIVHERSKWVFNFDQAPSEWLNPNVNMEANNTLKQIEDVAPHLLCLRKMLLNKSMANNNLLVEDYVENLKEKKRQFEELAGKYRTAYANHLDEKNREKVTGKKNLLIAAEKLVREMLPDIHLAQDVIEELALHHHEELISMTWTSLSLAAGVYQNITLPQPFAERNENRESEFQSDDRSEEILRSERRLVDFEELGDHPFRIHGDEREIKQSFEGLNKLKKEINNPKISMPVADIYQKCPFRYQIKGMDTGLGSVQFNIGIPYVVAANPRNSSIATNLRAGLTEDTIRVGLQISLTGTEGHHDRSRDGYSLNVLISVGSGLPAVRVYALQAAKSYLQKQCENTALPTSIREGAQAVLRSWPGAATFGGEFRSSETLVNGEGNIVSNPNYNTVVGGLGNLTSGSVSLTFFKVDPIDKKNKTEYKLQSISLLENESNTATLGLNLNIIPVTASLNYGHALSNSSAILTRLYSEPTVHMAQYPKYFETPVNALLQRIARHESPEMHPRIREVMLGEDPPSMRLQAVQICEELSVQLEHNPDHAQELKSLYDTYFHNDGDSFADIVESGLTARSVLPENERNENELVNGFTNLSRLHSSEAHWVDFKGHPYPTLEDINVFRAEMKALREEPRETPTPDRQLYYIFRTDVGRKMLNAYMDLVSTGVKMRLSGRLGTSTQSGTCVLKPNNAVITDLQQFTAELAERKRNAREEAEVHPGLNAEFMQP